jgi:hypothetical protein
VLATLLTILNMVCFYMITVHTPTFGGAVLHLAPKDNMVVTLCDGASNFFWLLIMGAVSDRIGQRPLLAAASGLRVSTNDQQFGPFVLSHAAQAFHLQFIRPDHILVLNEIRKFRRKELYKRG